MPFVRSVGEFVALCGARASTWLGNADCLSLDDDLVSDAVWARSTIVLCTTAMHKALRGDRTRWASGPGPVGSFSKASRFFSKLEGGQRLVCMTVGQTANHVVGR